MPSPYCTVADLVERFGGDEILGRGWPTEMYRYAGAVAGIAGARTWAAASPVPDAGDVVWDGSAFQRPDPDDPTGIAALDAARIELALTDATRQIDASLAVRYMLPVSSAAAGDVGRECADIARYALYDDAPTQTVRQRYEDATARLVRLAKGTEVLPDSSPDAGGRGGGTSPLAAGVAEMGAVPDGPWAGSYP